MMKTLKKAALICWLFSFLGMFVLSVPAAQATAAAAPVLSISPSSGVSGTTVQVSGTGFNLSNGTGLSLYFDSKLITPYGMTITGGNISQFSFTVPDYTLPGLHSVNVKGSAGIILAESQFYVYGPEIVLSRWSSPVGTTIKATCEGFHAGSAVTLQYYATDVPVTIDSKTVGDNGDGIFQFVVPASALGQHEVYAQNQTGDYALTNLEITSALSINLPVAYAGDKVDISGTGYPANSEVDAILHGSKVAFAQVSDRGSFDALFYVPVLDAGTYSVEIEDSLKNVSWIDFAVDAKMSVSKNGGEVGLKEQVTGTGFEVNGMVRIGYDGKEVVTVMANENGAFITTFDIPVSTAGGHIITVTDGITVKQQVFTVEGDAPPVPDIFAPKPDDVIAAESTFAWGTVYDPSEPVTYTFQISRTKDFRQPILEKDGLTESEYALTAVEALRPSQIYTSYYWRVRATDSASNIGLWTDPVDFQVEPSNALPSWARIVLIGVAVLLTAAVGGRIISGAWAVTKREKSLSK